MTLTLWLSLFAVCLLGAMSPGPSLAVVMRATMAGGRRSGFATALAHGAGVGLYGLLTVTGLAVVLTQSPVLYLAVQLLGALYLIWLGAKSLRGQASTSHVNEGSPHPVNNSRGAALEGFMVAFLNPKLAVFMLALFSQFLQPDFAFAEKALMAITVAATDGVWYCLVAGLISQPAFLARLRNSAGTIDRFFGVILIVLALSVLANALL
ncbi:MAG: threonine/homoserine/homoserine lactone efflux protein [Bacteroidia bacterium]